MSARASIPLHRDISVALAVICSIAFAVYVKTAYPTITWWDSSPHSLAAVTLGITTPPGSLLLTMTGWLATRLPIGLPPAHVLNLLAGAFATATVALVFLIAWRLVRHAGGISPVGAEHAPRVAVAGAALGTLAFAFSETFWQYAVQFTPYVLTTVFTALILWGMLRWWERAGELDAHRWLLLLGLLFGLDFSVHRTNLLLLPGLLVWIVLRHPRTLRTARAWIAGASGMVVGLAFHLLIIPIAASQPTLNAGDPSNWSRFYAYVSLAQYGGGWLVQFYPRHASLWHVQSMDLMRAFGTNFLALSGPLGLLGGLPALFGLIGLFWLWRRNRRLAVAVIAFLIVHAVITVLYFNIPANFFRSFHRHYLPVFVVWGVLMAYGMGESLAALRHLSWSGARFTSRLAGFLLALVPLSALLHRWTAIDGSRRYFTEDYATNALRGLPPNAILFTVGDNDTWPLVYMRVVGHVRPDVQIVNLSLANAPWYTDQVVRDDPAFPLPREMHDEAMTRPWTDTTLMVPVAGSPADNGLPDDLALPDSIALHATPTMGGKYVLRQDLVLLRVLEHNRWRRPLSFSTTMGEQGAPWLQPYRRLDGLFWRVVPHADPPANRTILRQNLLETYRYRGYAEPNVPLDEVSRGLGVTYYRPFIALAQAEYDRGDRDSCRQTRDTVLRLLPLSRLRPDPTLRSAIAGLCQP